MNNVLKNPTVDAVIVKGRMEGLYVVFRSGVTATETLHTVCAGDVNVYVDVDAQGVPIALELSGGWKPCTTTPRGSFVSDEEALLVMFRDACAMVQDYKQNKEMARSMVDRLCASSR